MNMQEGITYTHEHVTIDLSGVKQDMDCNLNCQDETIAEFRQLKLQGVTKIIDVTNRGMGRNVDYIMAVQAQTGVEIACATGYYKEPFFPPEVYDLTEEQLAKIMVGEIIYGIEESGVKAEIIGEIGTSQQAISLIERKVLGAGARAHIETGKPITTHTTLGRLGLEQIAVFKEYGVDLNKVVIGHVDLSGDPDYVLKLLEQGVYVAFDTIGKINYMSEEKRLEMLLVICGRGLADRVVVSMDITRRSHLKANGGLGYGYLLEKFIPFIRSNGISKTDIAKMLIHNAKKIFQ